MKRPGGEIPKGQEFLDFLSCTATELLDFPPDGDVYGYMVRALQKITPHGTIILINSLHYGTKTTTLEAFGGIGSYLPKIEEILGRPLLGISFSIPDPALIPLHRGRCEEIHGGLSALSFGSLSPLTCQRIESLPFFGKTYGAGISGMGALHGVATFILPPGQDLENPVVITQFVSQAAAYLQRRSVEEKLTDQYSLFEGIINSYDSPIFSVDTRFRYTSFNASHAGVMKALFGASIELGKSLLAYMTVEKDRELAEINLSRALSGEQFLVREFSGEEEKTRLFFEINHCPIRNARGRITGVAVFARDVTKRYLAQKALKESEATAKALINATTESALLLDRDGTILALNTVTAHRLGFTSGQELIGKNAYSLLPSELESSRFGHTNRVIETGEPARFEDIRSGRIIENSLYPVRDDTGRTFRIAIYGRDVTEERTAQAALVQSERFLADVLTSIRQGISVLDREFRILRVNAVMEEWFSHALPLIGKRCYEVYQQRSGPCHSCPVFDTLQTGKPSVRTVPKTGAPGSREGWLELHSFPLVDSTTGEMTGVIEYVHDISDVKEATDALRENEERLQLAMNASGLGIWSYDSATGDCHVYTGQNTVSGYSEEEIREYFQTFLSRNHRKSAPDFRAGAEGFSRDGFQKEIAVPGKEGDLQTILVRGNLVNRTVADPSTVLMGTFRNITEEKRKQDQIIRVSALKEKLLGTSEVTVQLKMVTDALVDIFQADFARIWLVGSGDLCEGGCIHATATDGPERCFDHERCLHLQASSGRYESVMGTHRRVPVGAYKIGRVASGEEPCFITNEAADDPRVHDHAWVRSLGLVSFAGFRLMSEDLQPAGVMALFRKTVILPREVPLLMDIADTLSHVIKTGKARKALQESEERFRISIENAPEAILLFDVRADLYIEANPRAEQLFGCSRQELLGHGPVFFYYGLQPDDQPVAQSVPDHLRQVLGGGTVTFERHIRNGRGEDRFLEVRLVKIEVGNKILVRSSFLDITDRKRAEIALLESENRYRSFVQNFRGIAYLSTADWVPVFFHGAVGEITGYQEDDFTRGEPRWDQVIFPDDLEVIQKRDTERLLFQPGCHIQREYRIRTKNGETRWVSDFIQNLVDDEGRLFLSGVLTDITGRKQMEAALIESEKRYRDLFEISAAVMLIIDPETSAVRDANAAACRYYGYTREEFSDMPLGRIQPLDQDLDRDLFSFSREDPGSVLLVRHRRADGEERVVEIFSGPVTISGKPLLHFIVQDVSERVAAEEALMQVNRKLTLLSGITRHDIKNQLTALMGYLEVSRECLSDSVQLTGIIDSEERIARTISQQISFTKDYEDLGVRAPAWHEVSGVVTKVASALPMGKVRLHLDTRSLEIFADPLLEKVFFNLIDNALRYGGEGLTTISVTAGDEECGCVISVTDDGAGISREDAKKLFTRGFGKNTGLGLYLSREILSITGITITEISEEGKGAHFRITVPRGLSRRS